MKREVIIQLNQDFQANAHVQEETGTDFWLARDLQLLLGYARWENFENAIERAIEACKNAGFEPADHFREVTKTVPVGASGGTRPITDVAMTRFACYLTAQNGDPAKEPIAFAQAYFAVQTRKQELDEDRIAEIERLNARKKLTQSEKELSELIFQRLGDGPSFGRIRSKGDKALFGGQSTEDMKKNLGISKGRPLADFLPTITIKAKDFANEITNFSVIRDDMNSENRISQEHIKNNKDVRKLLGDRDIVPEELPAAEDIKKIQRRIDSAAKQIPRLGGSLDDKPKK